MKSILQALRRPMKTIIGICIFSLAVSIFCVCLEQADAAGRAEKELEYQFTTVGLPTLYYQYETVEDVYYPIPTQPDFAIPYTYQILHTEYPDNLREFTASLEETYPDQVKCVSYTALASAYIPQLQPDYYVRHTRSTNSLASDIGRPYDCALLEIELDSYTILSPEDVQLDLPPAAMEQVSHWTVASLTGTVTQVLGLEENFGDPTGFTITVSLVLPDAASLSSLRLRSGERYLIYGSDYDDRDWEVRAALKQNHLFGYPSITQFEPDKLEKLPQYIIDSYEEYAPASDYTVATYRFGHKVIPLTKSQYAGIRSASLTAIDLGTLPYYDDTGQLLQTRSIRTSDGSDTTCTQEEYAARYSVPTIAHLTGTAEEFLNSSQGALWQEALDNLNTNNKTFPVLGVDKTMYLADFARQYARIRQGQDFTEEELASGAKVCLINYDMARRCGLKVGDTLTVQYQQGDYSNPYQTYIHDNLGLAEPSPYYNTRCTSLLEPETYTITGIYTLSNAWNYTTENPYAFTPNTVIVPKASISGSMDFGEYGLFQTVVLQNGTVPEFQEAITHAGFEYMYSYYDQGYTQIAGSIFDYAAMARGAAGVGIALYAGLLLLFLLLYPAQQGKNVYTMSSLGTPKYKMILHVLLGSLTVLVPGTLLGLGLGALCWDQVVSLLAQGADVTMTLSMDPIHFLSLALGQLILAALFSVIPALFLTRERGLAKRR